MEIREFDGTPEIARKLVAWLLEVRKPPPGCPQPSVVPPRGRSVLTKPKDLPREGWCVLIPDRYTPMVLKAGEWLGWDEQKGRISKHAGGDSVLASSVVSAEAQRLQARAPLFDARTS